MTSPTPEQNEILSTLEDLASIIQKTKTNLKKCPKQRLTEGYIKARLKIIDDYWDLFKEANNNLLKCTPREQRGLLPYFLNEEYYVYEELYLCLKGDLTDLLSSMEVKQKSLEVSNMSSYSQEGNLFAKLPRIQLPTFTGRYEDWPAYQDLFIALVHNTTLSDVQKLHYLKTSVSGEAEILLRHIKITGDNYTTAWELLRGRFGNKKIIVFSVLKRLFGQKKLSSQSASQIKNLLDTTKECVSSLNNLDICTDFWDLMLVFIVAQKLDLESLKDWEQYSYKGSDDMPTWKEFCTFLESKFRTLELSSPSSSYVKEKHHHKTFHATTNHTNVNSPVCSYCKGNHYIFKCKKFSQQPLELRLNFVKANHLCFNCLVPNHNVYTCKHKTTCRICKKRHHSLLHRSKETIKEDINPDHRITTAHFSKQQPGQNMLLPTAQILVMARDGKKHLLRALIDQGSEASFISARVMKLLDLSRISINSEVSGVGEGTQIPINYSTNLTVTSRFNPKENIRVTAYVLNAISTRLPSNHLAIDCQVLEKLNLADPNYDTPGKIDILLGGDVYCKIIQEGLKKITDGIVAQKTCLGWILSGQGEGRSEDNQHNPVTLQTRIMVKNEVDILKKLFTKTEDRCENFYNKSKYYEKHTVQLPFNYNTEETIKWCGDTRNNKLQIEHFK